MIFVQEYDSLLSLITYFLHPSVLLFPNLLLVTLFPNNCRLFASLSATREVLTHGKQGGHSQFRLCYVTNISSLETFVHGTKYWPTYNEVINNFRGTQLIFKASTLSQKPVNKFLSKYPNAYGHVKKKSCL